MLPTQILLQRSGTNVRPWLVPHTTMQRCQCRSFHWSRFSWTKSTGTGGDSGVRHKYTDKLQKFAEKKGVSLGVLEEAARRAAAKPKPLPEAETLRRHSEKMKVTIENIGGSGALGAEEDGIVRRASERRDNSPVKPLTDIMDIHRILRTPHTPEQVAALWTVFHSSRSGGTGRGFLSATVPLTVYESLLNAARRFPTFIIPLLRESVAASATGGDKEATDAANKQTESSGYEFFFMQWALHPPPVLVPSSSIFESTFASTSFASSPSASSSSMFSSSSPAANAATMLEHHKQPTHPLATVLFTPLLEYKTHGTFATPHLVLTLYPELAHTHSTVLLRGELTPSTARDIPSSGEAGGATRYLLSQHDAQMLAHGMQRFHLAEHTLMNMVSEKQGTQDKTDAGHRDTERRRECAQLLRLFNERPEEFQWKELLKHAT